MSTKVTESELMAESHEIFTQRKQASTHMNVIATETAKIQKVHKSLLTRLKDYFFYKADDWVAGDPLVLDSTKKTHDKVSPLFIRLNTIVNDLRAIDSIDFLDPYVKALEKNGIKIYIDPGTQVVTDKNDTLDAINSMGTFQKQINALNGELKEIKAVEAEDINLTKKSAFGSLVSFYDKKEAGKDVDDQYQSKVEELTLIETGLTKVYDGSLN